MPTINNMPEEVKPFLDQVAAHIARRIVSGELHALGVNKSVILGSMRAVMARNAQLCTEVARGEHDKAIDDMRKTLHNNINKRK